MGYSTNFSGEIHIDPPLTWGQIKDSPYLPEHAVRNGWDVKFLVAEEAVETDEGVVTKRVATALVPLTDEAYKGYDIIKSVNGIIADYPDHSFSGRFDCKGDDAGDLWRLVVRGRVAEKVVPRIVWPDEEA